MRRLCLVCLLCRLWCLWLTILWRIFFAPMTISETKIEILGQFGPQRISYLPWMLSSPKQLQPFFPLFPSFRVFFISCTSFIALPQISMVGHFSLVSSTAPAITVFLSCASAPSRIIVGSCAYGSFSAIGFIFFDLSAGLLFGAVFALVGQILASLVSVSSTLSRSCAVVVMVRSLLGATSDAGSSDAAILSC